MILLSISLVALFVALIAMMVLFADLVCRIHRQSIDKAIKEAVDYHILLEHSSTVNDAIQWHEKQMH